MNIWKSNTFYIHSPNHLFSYRFYIERGHKAFSILLSVRKTNLSDFPATQAIYNFGIGWDLEVPLRPWPQYFKKQTVKGQSYSCLALCGLFIGWTNG